MQIETLKMFCDVVATGSVSRAAIVNHVTQSAISHQVRALETRFARTLLTRTSHGVRPTPAGRRLAAACADVMRAFAALEGAVQVEPGEVSGEVIVATIDSVGLHELSPYLKILLVECPHVRVALNYRRSQDVVDDVLAERAHVGIVAYPARRRGLKAYPFSSDDLVLVCPCDHPLALKRDVRLADLRGARFVAFERDLPTGRAVARLLRAAEVEVDVVIEAGNIETMKCAVEMGLGASILPRAAVRAEEAAGDLVVRTFADGRLERPLGILVRAGRPPDRATLAVLSVLSRARRGSPRQVSGGPDPAAQGAVTAASQVS